MKKIRILILAILAPILSIGQNHISYNPPNVSVLKILREHCYKDSTEYSYPFFVKHDTDKVKILIFSNNEFEESYTIYGYRINSVIYTKEFIKLPETIGIISVSYNWKQ